MRSFRGILCLFLLSLTGCAPSGSLIILLPDPDGQVGTLFVETSKGKMAVDRPYYAVAAGNDKMPELPLLMNQKDVEGKFSAAMAIEPMQRFRFEKRVLYCPKNSAELTPGSKTEFAAALQQLLLKQPVEIYVVGHADRVGSEIHNQLLSSRRAQAIQQSLIASGINSRIIVVSFLGESRPQVETPDEVEEPRNRRVVLILKYNRAD